MRRGHAWRGKGQLQIAQRYVVDGQNYGHAERVHQEAVARGFPGPLATTAARLGGGATTWSELLAPLSVSFGRRSSSAKAAHKRGRDEAADALAALDARKKEMGL